MSEQAVPQPHVEAGAHRWHSIPELTISGWGTIWWALLFLVAAPIWLLVRSEGEQRAAGLLLMHAGAVGVFVVVRRQYLRILEWTDTFSAFLEDDERAKKRIVEFAHLPWHFSAAYVLFSAGFAAAAVALFDRGGLFDYKSSLDIWVALIFVAIASYVCALGLCAIFQLARLVRRVAEFKPFVAVHPFGVLSAGYMLLSALMDAAIVWCLYTATAAACRDAWLIPAAGLAVPAMAYFASSFIAAQLPLHREMLKYKSKRVREIERAMRGLERRIGQGVSEDVQRQLEFYERRMQNVLALPDWPFRWPSLFAVLGSGAVTVLAPLGTSAVSTLIASLKI